MIAPRPPLDVLVVGSRRRAQAQALHDCGRVQHQENLLAALVVLQQRGARVVVIGYEEIAGRERTAVAETRRVADDAKVIVLVPPGAADHFGIPSALGADDTLVEPFYPEALHRCVRGLLGPSDRFDGSGPLADREWIERREEILRDIGKAGRDLRLLRMVVVENLASLTGARRVSLLDRRSSAEELVLRYAVGLPPEVKPGTRIKMAQSVAGRVVERARPVVVGDVRSSEFRDLAHPERFQTSTFMIVPLVSQARVLGVLAFSDPKDGRPFTPMSLERVLPIVDTGAAVLRNARIIRQLRAASVLDGVTKLFNRRYFDRTLRNETVRSKRYGHPVSLLLADLDDFKIYNDTLGHLAGDTALRRVGKILKEVFRETDIVCRFGGDEFAVIMPETGREAAQHVLRRLGDELAGADFEGARCLPLGRFEASCGIATFPEDADNPRDLVQAADEKLYEVKRAKKRDRVENAPTG